MIDLPIALEICCLTIGGELGGHVQQTRDTRSWSQTRDLDGIIFKLDSCNGVSDHRSNSKVPPCRWLLIVPPRGACSERVNDILDSGASLLSVRFTSL